MIRAGLKTFLKAYRNSTSSFRATLVASLMVLSFWPAQAGATPQEVRFQIGGGDRAALSGRLHRPNSRGVAPAVVLMHGCGGWQPEVLASLENYARFLSSNGFVVLNLDSFGPRGNGGGVVCGSTRELARARDYRTRDAFAALAFLRAQSFVDGDNIFLVGQSNGGSVALISSLRQTVRRYGGQGFRGVVALYPWCGATGSSRRLDLHSPLLVLGGGRDDWVPPRDCTRFQGNGHEVSVKVFPNAAHSYDLRIPVQRYLGNLVGYNPNAAATTRVEMLSFFQRHRVDRQAAVN